MQQESSTTNTSRKRTVPRQREESSGEKAAVTFKYYQQYLNPRLKFIQPKWRISAKTLYSEYKDVFDRLAKAFDDKKISFEPYIKFFVTKLHRNENDIEQDLVSKSTLHAFNSYLSTIRRKREIYNLVMSSIDTIAEYCVSEHVFGAREGLAKLIRDRKLAPWYVAGKISKYYLAAIPRCDELVARLDQLSRQTLSDVETRYDMYNTDVNEAFLYVRKVMPNPIKLTNDRINEILGQ